MNVLEKQRLCRLHDDSLFACALRLRAARAAIGISQTDAAGQIGVGKTTLNNAEMGRNYPSLDVMRWLFRAHRIDFNFILAGEFAQLPADVQESIFVELQKTDEQIGLDQTTN